MTCPKELWDASFFLLFAEKYMKNYFFEIAILSKKYYICKERKLKLR